MLLRTPTVVAVLTLLGLAGDNPASAQPVVPTRPRSNTFQNLFFPGSPAVPNAGLGMNRGGQFGGNQFGPQAAPQGIVALGGPTGQTPFLVIPVQTQPAVFNNLGHWYSGYYGHWYPNGIRSGMGVLANSGGGGAVGMGGAYPANRGAFGTGTPGVPSAFINLGGGRR